jgi:hypothetical protein
MAIVGTDWHWFSGYGNTYNTVQVNIPPAHLTAEVSLYGTTGDGTQYAGIRSHRQRRADGSDQTHDFGGTWYNWPPMIGDFVSSITFALATGSDQAGWILGRMDYWG